MIAKRRPASWLLGGFLVLLSAQPFAEVVSELHGDCGICHGEAGSGTDGSLVRGEPELCRQCHLGRAEHAILVPAVVRSGDLPLFNGLMTCITCHDPHGTESLQLRLPAWQLCTSCHEK